MFGSKSKIFFTLGIVIMFIVLIFGLFFMTQYANVHVFYSIDSDTRELVINPTTKLTIGSITLSNTYVFSYLRSDVVLPATLGPFEEVEDVQAVLQTVYNFQMTASKFNSNIIIFFLVGLICVGALYLFDNNKRKTYYISNLVIGIAAPVVMIIFSIVMIVNDLSLISNFESNKDLYKIVGVMQDSSIDGIVRGAYRNKPYEDLLSRASNINTGTMIAAIVLFALVAAYFTFILVFTLLKYKATSKARKETIERAVNAND